MELISIVIPVYNGEKTIEQAIVSAQAQTYQNIEIVVVNDGSKDHTDFICRKLASKDCRIRYFATPNSGVSAARNFGIQHSNGTYLAFLDSDDALYPNFVQEMLSAFTKEVDLVCCGYDVFRGNQNKNFSQVPAPGAFSAEYYYQAIEIMQEQKCLNVLWNKMFRKRVIIEFSLNMDTSISMGEDLIFVLSYIQCITGQVRLVEKALYRYYISINGLQANSANWQLRFEQLQDIRLLYDKFKYPLDGFYLEAMRTIYVVLLENRNSTKSIKDILKQPICAEISKTSFRCGGKYAVLRALIKAQKVSLILLAVKFFRLLKKASNQAFDWN